MVELCAQSACVSMFYVCMDTKALDWKTEFPTQKLITLLSDEKTSGCLSIK